MHLIVHPLIAAGYVEVTESPLLLGSACVISTSYLAMLAIPAFRIVRSSEREERKLMAAFIACILAGPFLVRWTAGVVLGGGMLDWHNIWLFLLTTILVGCGLLALIEIRLFLAKKKAPNQASEPTAGLAPGRGSL